MSGAATTKGYREGDTTPFDGREWDESGSGAGPFSAMPVLSNGAGGQLSKAEDAAHVSGDHGFMMLGVRKDTAAALAGADGDYQPPIFDATGKLYVNAAITAGSTATDLGKAEDAAHASGDVGVMMLTVRKDTAAATAGSDGDYQPPITDANGRLHVLPAGNVAHDGVDSGSPIKVGAYAVNAEPTAVANGDRVNLIADLVGKLITLPYANPENFVSGAITTAMTGTTSTSLVGAPGAGLRNYITTIIVSNAHATVGTDVIIQDGSGGTTLLTIPAAAVYGGAVINLPVPLRQPTANTALFCANVTTGASTKVSAVGYKGA
jgi:hypothetical protein